MTTKKLLILLGLSFWGFTACNLVSLSPVPTMIADQATGTPTITLQPTIPALPTDTLTPTLPTPTLPPPGVLTQYLENVRIVNFDTFDDSSGWGASNEVSNGVLTLVGSGNWDGLPRNGFFQEGDGVVINFKFTRGELFEMYFEHGKWNSTLYKRFGVYVDQDLARSNLFIGKDLQGFNPIPGNLAFAPDTWYSFFMAIGKGGDFLALLWDPTDPLKSRRYRESIPNWKELGWTFRIQASKGIIVFDDFEQIVFDRIR